MEGNIFSVIWEWIKAFFSKLATPSNPPRENHGADASGEKSTAVQTGNFQGNLVSGSNNNVSITENHYHTTEPNMKPRKRNPRKLFRDAPPKPPVEEQPLSPNEKTLLRALNNAPDMGIPFECIAKMCRWNVQQTRNLYIAMEKKGLTDSCVQQMCGTGRLTKRGLNRAALLDLPEEPSEEQEA